MPDPLALRRRNRFLEDEAVAPGKPSGFDLIIAAPQNNAGMAAQPRDLLDSFLAHVLLKCKIARHHVTAEHKLLPDHKAKFVANVVKDVRLINAAAPLAHHVHVGIARGLQDLAIPFGRDPAGKTIERNNVGAFGKNRNPVDHEGEALAPLVGHAA